LTQTFALTSDVPQDQINDFSFLWSTGETTPTIEVNQEGVFTVIATSFVDCSTFTKTITVTQTTITAILDTIKITNTNGLNNNIIVVNVLASGEYDYALDNINGPYQTSNRFENVDPGFHTVFIRDIANCSRTEVTIPVIGFPKFFTPNGDSIFDTWQVIGLSSDFQPTSSIFIFDRYGKLLKQLDPLGPGWDGTFNGQRLPTNDYWYGVTLLDGTVFRGHFTLKR